MEGYYFQIFLIYVMFYLQRALSVVPNVLIQKFKKSNIIGIGGQRLKTNLTISLTLLLLEPYNIRFQTK